MYVYIYIYNAEINDKEYYFFRNSEFHAACATIFSLYRLSQHYINALYIEHSF